MRWPRRRVLFASAVLYSAISVGYEIANVWHWRPPFVLPWTSLDRAIPFIDWTIWIYLSHFVMQAWLVVELAHEGVHEPLAAVAYASAISIALFFVLPTALQEQRFWRPGPWAEQGFRLADRLNTPANCIPSLHVALAAIAARAICRLGPIRGAFAVVWAAAIIISTLTAKQHTAVDVPAGLVVAWLSWRLSNPLEAS